MVKPRAEPHFSKGLLGPLGPLLEIDPSVDQGKSHIVYSRQAGQEIEALEHKANAGIARMGQFIICITGNILTFEDILPRCRAVKTAQDIHQRRLPAS